MQDCCGRCLAKDVIRLGETHAFQGSSTEYTYYLIQVMCACFKSGLSGNLLVQISIEGGADDADELMLRSCSISAQV